MQAQRRSNRHSWYIPQRHMRPVHPAPHPPRRNTLLGSDNQPGIHIVLRLCCPPKRRDIPHRRDSYRSSLRSGDQWLSYTRTFVRRRRQYMLHQHHTLRWSCMVRQSRCPEADTQTSVHIHSPHHRFRRMRTANRSRNPRTESSSSCLNRSVRLLGNQQRRTHLLRHCSLHRRQTETAKITLTALSTESSAATVGTSLHATALIITATLRNHVTVPVRCRTSEGKITRTRHAESINKQEVRLGSAVKSTASVDRVPSPPSSSQRT